MDLETFLKVPSHRAWARALKAGWRGPDGSSSSTDTMMGVRIGVSHPSYRWHSYPANLHDWRYYLGRSHGLGPRYRHAADVEYRAGCKAALRASLEGPFLWLGLLRADLRYIALRLFGGSAFRAG